MKIYTCTVSATPAEIFDIAKLHKADIVLVEKIKGFLTVVYAITEEAKGALAKLDFRKLESEVFNSAYVPMMKLEQVKEVIKGNFPETVDI